jgi:hypothetical protein
MSATNPIDENTIAIRRMLAESDKFAAEQRKLGAEADKLTRDRQLAPWQVAFSGMTAGAALFAAGAAFMRFLGH